MRRYGRIDQVSAHGTYTYTHPTLDPMHDGGWVKFDDAQAIIAALESKLAEAETTIGALKHLIGEQTDQLAASEAKCAELEQHIETRDAITSLHIKHQIEVDDELTAVTARAEEAERVAVWAANNVHGVMLGNRGRTEIHFWAPDGVPESVTCDGTDADIYRALREAMGASEGGDERARAAQREG